MEIKIVENMSQEMEIDIEKIKKGIAKTEKKIVMTPEIFAKVFSPKKIRLLLAIRKYKIDSISMLARLVNRRFEAVHRDLAYLSGFGIVTIKKENYKSIPSIHFIPPVLLSVK